MTHPTDSDSQVLARVIETMSLESDFEKMCQFATKVTMEVLGANLSALALPDDRDAERGLRFRFFSGFPPEIDTAGLPGITPGTAAAFKSGKCVFVADYANYAGAMPAYTRAGVRSGFAAPIRLGDVVTGVLTLAWTQPAQQPGARDTELVEAVLRQVGFAYQRDQLVNALSASRAEAVAVHQRLERVLAVSPVVIYTATLDPKQGQSSLDITYLSDNIHSLFGHSKDFLTTDPSRWYGLVHPDDLHSMLLQNNPEAFAQGSFERTYRVRHREGHYLWIHDSLRLFPQPGQAAFHVVGAILDITDRKRDEAELRRHRDHLQELVREQTADLLAARDAAEKAMREAKQAEEQTRYLALNDALTGLPNRVLLQERLNHAMALCQRTGKKLALLFIDLDRFKNINDSLGHSVGDRLLCEVSRRLSGCVRQSDTVSRQGGDEFIILLSQIDGSATVSPIAESLLSAVAKPYVIDDYELSVTHSIGISIYPDDGRQVEDIMRKADAAMYRAKDLGRNNFQFYTQDMGASALSRLSLENDLRRALEKREFHLVYQPLIALDGGRVVGVEALVRWLHPERGLLYPRQFIDLAEENGQIVGLGHWVLGTACAQAQAWRELGLDPGPVAVNLSPVQLRRKKFLDEVIAVLADTGLPSHGLKLELTESMLMHDTDNTASVLRVLRGLGVQLAIDDFGTHYSSLSYLKRFPVDSLKIDGSFIRDIHTDPDDAAITRAIISIGHSLRLTVAAEGVETREQYCFLEQLGCDEVQGYLLGGPLSAEEMGGFLSQRQSGQGGGLQGHVGLPRL